VRGGSDERFGEPEARRGAHTSRQGLTGLTTADHTRHAACRRFGKGRDSIHSLDSKSCTTHLIPFFLFYTRWGPQTLVYQSVLVPATPRPRPRTIRGPRVHAVSMALAHGTWLLTTVVGNERVVWGRFDRSDNDCIFPDALGI